MANQDSAVSIWMDGSVDGEDIATLSALIQDFERDLDLKLRVEEPTRLRSRLAFDSVTQVDLRSLLLDSPVVPEDSTLLYRRPGRDVSAREDETRRIIPLKKRWPREDGWEDGWADKGKHLHLIVESPDRLDANESVALVVNLSTDRPPTREVVVHIARAIEEVLGPQCQIRQVSPDEVYLQTLEELRQNQPNHLTGRWFAAGLAAEHELGLRPGTLPPLYANAELWRGADDEDDVGHRPVQRVRSGRKWVLALTVVVILLGLSFVQTGPMLRWLDHQVTRIVDSVAGL